MKRRFRAMAVGCTVLLVASVVPTSAQEDDSADLNPGEGIPIGPFIFSPSIDLTWEYRENVFFEESGPKDDHVYTAKGRLMFELPYHNRYVRFIYTPKYREYDKYDKYIPEHWSHFVDLVSALEFASGLNLRTVYRYVSGNLETPEIDPGLEHVWGYRQFGKHDLKLKAEYWFRPRDALFVEGGFIDLQHKKPKGFYYGEDDEYYEWAAEAYFYDYTRWRFGLGWTHQWSETVKLDVRYRHEDFQAHETLSYRDSTSEELTVGLNGQISDTLSSTLRLGWRETTFDTSMTSQQVDDYSGLSASGSLSWELAHGSTLTLDVTRWDHPSAWDRNAYYTSSGAGLLYDLTWGRLYGTAMLKLRRNEYDIPQISSDGTRSYRTDDILRAHLLVGYWITDWLSVRASIFHEDRESLIPYEYDATAYLLGLTIGY